jgi:hypothetical protein
LVGEGWPAAAAANGGGIKPGRFGDSVAGAAALLTGVPDAVVAHGTLTPLLGQSGVGAWLLTGVGVGRIGLP